ncbi:uncharacterized protein LOC142767673 isoform X2 [Rhipicephalus microplus]|uniref:uncharacterized protein LOC142767673 isoform X2 n=1 Tax=Rhipicephalus microplus TaxID=6941 RepID=UPI003F6C2C4E
MLEIMEGESEPVAVLCNMSAIDQRSRLSRRQRTCEGASNAGEGTSHEAVAQACMEHLEHIRGNRGVIK